MKMINFSSSQSETSAFACLFNLQLLTINTFYCNLVIIHLTSIILFTSGMGPPPSSWCDSWLLQQTVRFKHCTRERDGVCWWSTGYLHRSRLPQEARPGQVSPPKMFYISRLTHHGKGEWRYLKIASSNLWIYGWWQNADSFRFQIVLHTIIGLET